MFVTGKKFSDAIKHIANMFVLVYKICADLEIKISELEKRVKKLEKKKGKK